YVAAGLSLEYTEAKLLSSQQDSLSKKELVFRSTINESYSIPLKIIGEEQLILKHPRTDRLKPLSANNLRKNIQFTGMPQLALRTFYTEVT
ncbi:hypothetical protein L9F63_011442, partial [Diploptera punctata]